MKDDKYITYSHAKVFIRYHLVFSTKFRKPCLSVIKETIVSAFRYVDSHSKFNIERICVDDDHVHLLVKSPPTLSVSQIVQRMKAVTLHYVWNREGSYMRKYYWKQKRVLWTHGYFCSTIGNVSENKIIEYIEKQG